MSEDIPDEIDEGESDDLEIVECPICEMPQDECECGTEDDDIPDEF